MAANIALLLDKAKVIHRLSSDYKLALVLGVDQKSLRNYRAGITLPDARVISLLCGLTGDDPTILAVEIEEQRAKTDEARNLWHMVAQRLQAGAAAAIFSVLFVLGFGAGLPMDAHASAPTFQNFSSYTSWKVYRFTRLFGAFVSPLVRILWAFVQGFTRVPRSPQIAPA